MVKRRNVTIDLRKGRFYPLSPWSQCLSWRGQNQAALTMSDQLIEIVRGKGSEVEEPRKALQSGSQNILAVLDDVATEYYL